MADSNQTPSSRSMLDIKESWRQAARFSDGNFGLHLAHPCLECAAHGYLCYRLLKSPPSALDSRLRSPSFPSVISSPGKAIRAHPCHPWSFHAPQASALLLLNQWHSHCYG